MKFILTNRIEWVSSLSPSVLALERSIVRDQKIKEVNTKMVTREYFKVSELAEYTGISDRTLRDLLKDPVNPIPHYRIGAAGRIVRIKKSEFDQWMREQMIRESSLVDDVLGEIF
jgi:excisionase family DNA binding protein